VKRDPLCVLAVAMVVLSAPSTAQTTGQRPTATVQPPPPPPAEGQGNDEASKPAVKEKICSPVLIRAGPNQGQIISKCRHTDRGKGQASS